MRPIDEHAAVLFDLDGVLTPTAEVHRRAWTRTFDRVLAALGRPDRFALEDYLQYVDGKPRYAGVHSFLRSRDIELPAGDPTDPPSLESEAGIGNLKNVEFNAVLHEEGVDPYPGSAALLDHLEEAGVAVAVVSSSANARGVLRAAGLEPRFPVVVDGLVAAQRDLPGKPAPDTFLAAAAELGVAPSETVVVEDALSGVQAGVAGGFALVVGVDREGQAEALRAAGAHLVVGDLGELLPDAAGRSTGPDSP
ncbi:MAG TPA: beta-phosphoglucomutase family hydrolase [Acidimicrobiia bacterium]|nr:beta-phosphoglucomutase family hydrolase [Acidimicrobiia bacterium]